ncbi:Uncharacterised protein [Bordetella ansorpii]|uniref:Uncharacterized protein n=1 Tax=Bordetella ansorpii TaxID=288768 RepID=A0A157SEJ2_9BORD|nr:hypothetical protein [Bordetella ansorpii]SAI68862.1 Uncharacterised protein [Bordetella ansorpii]
MTTKQKSHPRTGEKDPLERELDDALDDTFPASDPVSIDTGKDPEDRKTGHDQSVDEALEDTFPASDPAAPSQPGKQ